MSEPSHFDRSRIDMRVWPAGIPSKKKWNGTFVFVWCVVTAVIIAGTLMHINLWKDDRLGEDIKSIWQDAHTIFSGENPYTKILSGNMRENQKYATYFPLFYLLGALMEAIGFNDYTDWIVFWRWIFLLCNLGIGVLLFLIIYRRGHLILAIFSMLFWLFSRWTLNLTTIGQIDFVPILFLLASLALFERNRWVALLLLSCSLATKQIAIFVVPLYLIWVWQSSERNRTKHVSVAALVIMSVPLLASLPFIIWNAEGFVRSIIFSATRYATNHFKVSSLDELIAEDVPSFIGIPAKLPMLFLMALVYLVVMRHTVSRYAAVLLILSIFVEFNSVLFRQYMTWVVPFIPLAVCDLTHRPQPGVAKYTDAHERET